jgi:hypothetical protein
MKRNLAGNEFESVSLKLNRYLQTVLSASVSFVSAVHKSDFGSARYGLVSATGRQSRQ